MIVIFHLHQVMPGRETGGCQRGVSSRELGNANTDQPT
jgi:hypothetical protein